MHRVLTLGFSTFLRRRRAQRHFERRPPPGTALAKVPAPQSQQALSQNLLAAAAGEQPAALALLKSHPDGLDAAEFALRLALDGLNEIQHEAPPPEWLSPAMNALTARRNR